VQVTEGATPTAFFGRTFEETMELLEEARDYAAGGSETERRLWQGAEPLSMGCELTRVTARLAWIMAWLLTWKAVHAGEIPLDVALGKANRLGGRDICLNESSDHSGAGIPPGLADLLDRSRRLYVRVSRLDELAGRSAA